LDRVCGTIESAFDVRINVDLDSIVEHLRSHPEDEINEKLKRLREYPTQTQGLDPQSGRSYVAPLEGRPPGEEEYRVGGNEPASEASATPEAPTPEEVTPPIRRSGTLNSERESLM
jgi:hypothetical protein